MNQPRIGSLFSGMGGLDAAVEEVFGARTVWVSDIDKGACKILAHRFPDVPNLGDITAIDWSTVEPVDIITGGSPCQDLSHAGKRAGMTDGTRSNLWVAMREAIAQLKPSIVVWENVRGAASAEATSDLEFCSGCMGEAGDRGPVLRALGRVVGDLADLGYVGRVRGLRASDVGSCHGRFRFFLVAYPRSEHGIEWGQPAPGQASSGRALGELAGRGGAPVGLLPTPTSRDWKDGPYVAAVEENCLLGRVVWNLETDFGQYAPAVARWESVIGRPAPAPTEPTGKGGAHRLSPRFTEWMMGAPDGWITDVPGLTRNEALKACGNGVVQQQAVAALRIMLTAECAA